MPARSLCAAIVGIALILGSGCGRAPSSSQDSRNVSYLRDTLGSIVIAYDKKHGETPQIFEMAHDESNVVLPHRGDYYGRPLGYKKTGQHSFYFHSIGRNKIDEHGAGDDLIVSYSNGRWSVGEAPADATDLTM